MSSKKKTTKIVKPKIAQPIVLKEGDYPIIAGGVKYPTPLQTSTNLYQVSVNQNIAATTTAVVLTFTGRYLTIYQIRIFGTGGINTLIGDATGGLLYIRDTSTTVELFFQKPYYFKDNLTITNNTAGAILFYLDVQGEQNQTGFIP